MASFHSSFKFFHSSFKLERGVKRSTAFDHSLLSQSDSEKLVPAFISCRVQEAQGGHPTPKGYPPDCLFVPPSARSLVLQRGHTSKVACYPGLPGTLALLQSRFWWPSMSANTEEFVFTCSVCASSHSASASLLHPLPIPHRPSLTSWTSLLACPPSVGYTTILTIVDCISRAVHFIPLSPCPTAGPACVQAAWHSSGHCF